MTIVPIDTSFKPVALAALVLALVTANGPTALALSCTPPEMANSYKFWEEAEQTYTIARGTLKPLGTLPLKRSNTIEEQDNPSLLAVQYRFKGVLIGKSGNVPADFAVTVQPACWAIWCGAYPEGNRQGIYALETSGTDYRFVPNPCSGNSFHGDLNRHEAKLRDCMKGGECQPATHQNGLD